jgi:uncharacterized membrane protein
MKNFFITLGILIAPIILIIVCCGMIVYWSFDFLKYIIDLFRRSEPRRKKKKISWLSYAMEASKLIGTKQKS